MKRYIVITTINAKTEGIRMFESLEDWNIIVVGDKRSKPIDSSDNLTFLSFEKQKSLGYKFTEACPCNHYARKNIGYLYAMEQGAGVIYDTDDDNLPLVNWYLPDFTCGRKYISDKKYINIYKYFSKENIWPRGYPLDEIHTEEFPGLKETRPVAIGVWQGLADVDPDVDAIYRLTVNRRIKFDKAPPVVIESGHYSPFNSQNTFWNPKAFPLLYLPATTSFRFTDILRGYVAQPLLWKNSLYLGFTSATVYQARNVHDLMKDFKDEICCYLNTKEIIKLLDSIELENDIFENLLTVYRALDKNEFIRPEEVQLLNAWISDVKRIYSNTGKA